MSRRLEILALVLGDALASAAALAAVASGPPEWDWLTASGGAWPVSALGIVAAWGLLIAFAGLYAERYARGRLDELVTLARVVTVGGLALLFGVVIDRLQGDSLRASIAFYALVQFAAVGGARLAVRSVQRALVVRGYGRHRAVVIGWSDRVETLYHDLAAYPAADIELVGAVRLRAPAAVPVFAGADPESTFEERYPGGDALPSGAVEVTASGAPEAALAELPGLIDRLGVHDVLIALGSDDHETLDEVLRVCDGKPVRLKLVPDFYAAVGGMARTEHTYGLPLIEVLPEPMPAWERRTKRIADVLVSAAVLAAGAPLWLALAALVRLTSPGPAVYRQTRVGRHGAPFTMLKFRTMVDGAERETGPVWAADGDRRVTPVGRWLRRLRLDEVPQLWNVLTGEMSLVGPRPERPFFVGRLRDQIPLYSRRHRVQPGITGLAQVHLRYDDTIDDVRQKLKYDLFYIETMSLGSTPRSCSEPSGRPSRAQDGSQPNRQLGGTSRRAIPDMPEVSTVRILAEKALQEPCGQECVDWAVSMLAAGSDGTDLTMLASIAPPYNHFEVADLRDRALAEEGVQDLSADDAIRVLAAERLRLALRGEADMTETLRTVMDLCVAHDYRRDLYDFYLLYHTLDTLDEFGEHGYWNGATAENVDSIIRDRAERFIAQVLGAA